MGDLEIFELNRQLVKLPEAAEHHTLAGFLLEQLQHIPSEGGRCDTLAFNLKLWRWMACGFAGCH